MWLSVYFNVKKGNSQEERVDRQEKAINVKFTIQMYIAKYIHPNTSLSSEIYFYAERRHTFTRVY